MLIKPFHLLGVGLLLATLNQAGASEQGSPEKQAASAIDGAGFDSAPAAANPGGAPDSKAVTKSASEQAEKIRGGGEFNAPPSDAPGTAPESKAVTKSASEQAKKIRGSGEFDNPPAAGQSQ